MDGCGQLGVVVDMFWVVGASYGPLGLVVQFSQAVYVS